MKKLLLTLLVFSSSVPLEAYAEAKGSSTGFPIPRFVSLRSDEVNIRSGPGKQYPIKWVLVRKNMPVEIVKEYDHWRRIRDIQGDEGWVHKGLLSGKRTATIKSNNKHLLKNASADSKTIAILEQGVIVEIDSCSKNFCKSEVEGVKGYLENVTLWGTYFGEDF